MNEHEREALETLQFDWAHVPDDVWRLSPYHVDELHETVLREVTRGVREASRYHDRSPIGIVLQGQRGVGKTHLLGLVRRHVQACDGYFFLVTPHDGRRFWEHVAQSMLQGLLRPVRAVEDPPSQLRTALAGICARAGVLDRIRDAVLGDAPLTARALSSFIGALRRLDPVVGLECQDTARALVLYSAPRPELQDVGHHFLSSMEDDYHGERSAWHLAPGAKQPRQVVREISLLLALTGPIVVAVDQVDGLIEQAVKASDAPGGRGGSGLSSGADGAGDAGVAAEEALPLEQLAGGLMTLRDITRRTLTVLACLPDSWTMIRQQAVNTAADRFREALPLGRLPDSATGHALVAKRFSTGFGELGFTPPYPTWPVAEEAFADAPQLTPRSLLQRIDSHVQSCLRSGTLRELTTLVQAPPHDETPPQEAAQEAAQEGGDRERPAQTAAPSDWEELDSRFTTLTASAEVSQEVAAALDPETEDTHMPPLLSAGLTAWITERGGDQWRFSLDPSPGPKPALHARIRCTLDEHSEAERQASFRAVGHSHARAVQTRVQHAATAAGLHAEDTYRRLYLLRSTGWPSGPKTATMVREFHERGGQVVAVDEGDLRTFAALRRMLADRDPHLQGWLLARQPASGTTLLAAALGDEWVVDAAAPAEGASATAAAGTGDSADSGTTDSAAGPVLALGAAATDGAPLEVPLASLRRHTAIFAGSGSGKSVLLRRLVEQCAAAGVSAIVLDPHDELARLGDPWPEPPAGWQPGDADHAEDYLAHTDVVVWTPGRDGGLPLTFQPLPDFAAVRDDPDELNGAVEAAMAALAPRAKVDGRTSKAAHRQAVLREALSHFARNGGGTLKQFLSLLADLPGGVSALDKAEQIAAEVGQTLTAATVNDPLFGGEGTPADPGVLLSPAEGKRARVSVVSMAGLATEEQRQSFVHQLQMALFAWLRRHPAGAQSLSGLFVMDEAQTFAPAGGLTACTRSTLALASQARKYGLGLVFATQSPKGVHNQIPGNAATQFFGFLNAPAQIAAATEMARAKGGAVVDISRLDRGEFYAAATGLAFRKLRAPMCLSHHPGSALTTEEVLARARRAT